MASQGIIMDGIEEEEKGHSTMLQYCSIASGY
jgi:hypothetical protein